MAKAKDDLVIDARPTKEFFIYMLTKDILLIRAIIDLVDNSWDGALRVSKKHPLNRLSIDLDITENSFVISDNCGGIPYNVAKNYAFRFGRPTDMERTDHSVGQFGVGMKRSLFKIGSKFRQPANKNVPTNPLLGGTVGSRGSFLMAATPKVDLTLSYLA